MTVTHLCSLGVSEEALAEEALAEEALSLAVADEDPLLGRVGLATQSGRIWDYALSPDPVNR